MKPYLLTTAQNLTLGPTLSLILGAGLLNGTVEAAEPTPVNASPDLEIREASVS